MVTQGALSAAKNSGDCLIKFVRRHQSGDWGELCEDDKLENEKAVRLRDRRIFSAYYLSDGTKIWVITERDFSATTILLPEEY